MLNYSNIFCAKTKTYILYKNPEKPFKQWGCQQCMFVKNIHKHTYVRECRFMLMAGGSLLIIFRVQFNGRN